MVDEAELTNPYSVAILFIGRIVGTTDRLAPGTGTPCFPILPTSSSRGFSADCDTWYGLLDSTLDPTSHCMPLLRVR